MDDDEACLVAGFAGFCAYYASFHAAIGIKSTWEVMIGAAGICAAGALLCVLPSEITRYAEGEAGYYPEGFAARKDIHKDHVPCNFNQIFQANEQENLFSWKRKRFNMKVIHLCINPLQRKEGAVPRTLVMHNPRWIARSKAYSYRGGE